MHYLTLSYVIINEKRRKRTNAKTFTKSLRAITKMNLNNMKLHHLTLEFLIGNCSTKANVYIIIYHHTSATC